jgi:hypothetical protein
LSPTRAQAPRLCTLDLRGTLDLASSPWDALARLTRLASLRILTSYEATGVVKERLAGRFDLAWLPLSLERCDVHLLKGTGVVDSHDGDGEGGPAAALGPPQRFRAAETGKWRVRPGPAWPGQS